MRTYTSMKDRVSFWKYWRIKFNGKNLQMSLKYLQNPHDIAEKFADTFEASRPNSTCLKASFESNFNSRLRNYVLKVKCSILFCV